MYRFVSLLVFALAAASPLRAQPYPPSDYEKYGKLIRDIGFKPQ